MSTISTHVLDTARGIPAEGLPITLEEQEGSSWHRIGGGVTNDDGRVRDLLEPDRDGLINGVYRMTFDTSTYFDRHDLVGFYPIVRIVFEVTDAEQHYHVPLLLSPYGYSTYRGS